MKKKLTAVALVVCMFAIMLVGATMAYFTDDEQVTNTMVIGDVKIEIEENVKSADGKSYLKFESDQFTLYPIENAKASGKTAFYNKVVRTFNTSTRENDAYIRTIVLFEKNDLLDDEYANDGSCCPAGLHFMYVSEAGSSACVDGKSSRGSACKMLKDCVTIGENEYWVVVFTDVEEKAIPYNDSLHTLNGVWMDKGITSEQVAGNVCGHSVHEISQMILEQSDIGIGRVTLLKPTGR